MNEWIITNIPHQIASSTKQSNTPPSKRPSIIVIETLGAITVCLRQIICYEKCVLKTL